MAFEEFTLISGRITPTISIGRGGFGISSGFMKKYPTLSSSVGVKLYFDAERKAVGLRFAATPEENLAKMKPLNKGGFYLSARSFLIKYDIDRDKYEPRYIPKEEQTPQGMLFVFALKQKE